MKIYGGIRKGMKNLKYWKVSILWYKNWMEEMKLYDMLKNVMILVVGVTNTGFMVVEQLIQIVMTVTGVHAVLKVLNLVQN